MSESALIVPVPEAEPLVGAMRAQFDATASLGVPAHITILHPFVPPERITSDAGRYASILPHLTVARGDETRMRVLQAQLSSDVRLQRGIGANCAVLVLIGNSGGSWTQLHRFSFGMHARNET